ncbi:PAS domain S-box protein, partial [Thermodesulfobacteriota bacterium]
LLVFTSSSATLRDADGKLVAAAGVIADITERKRAEEKLKEARDELERSVDERTAELAQANRQLQRKNSRRKVAEEEVKTNSARLEYLLSHGPAVIYTCEPSGDYGATFISENIKAQMGYKPTDFMEDPTFWANHIHPEDRDRVFRGLNSLFEQDHHVHEYRFLHADGTYKWMRDELILCRDTKGNPQEILGYWSDITDRKKAEQSLQKSREELELIVNERTAELTRKDKLLREREEQLQTIFQASPAAIFLVNPEGRITFANQSMGTLFSCESDELLGTPYVELVHPEERTIGHGKMKSLMAGEIDHVSLERRYVSADGREFVGHLSGLRRLGPDGDLTGLVGIITDITGRKKAEEALRESEEHYKNFFENALVGLFRSRLSDGLFLEINPKAAEQQGLPVGEIVGKVRSVDRYRNPDQRKELISRLKQDGEVHDFEADLTLHDGRDVTFSLSVKAYPERDYLEGAVIDITDRKKAEEALRKSEEQYRHLYNNAELGLFQTRVSDGKIVTCNQRCAEITGYDDIGQFIEEYVVSEHYVDPTVRLRLIEELKRTGSVKDFEAEITDRWGNHRWWCYSVKHYPEEGVMEGSIIDITAHKKAEEALRESEEKFRTIFDGAGDGIFGVDPQTRKAVVVSPSMCGITGYTQPDLLQLRADDLHPEEHRPHVLEQFSKLLQGEISLAKEVPVLRKNGDLVYCDISAGFARFGGREVLLGFFRNVTQLKLAEQTVRESQERYRILFEQSKDAILIVHPEGMIIDANAACGDLLGAVRDEIVGANVLQFYQNPFERDRLRKEIGQKGFVRDFDWRVRQKSGDERHCLLTSTAWKNEHGTVLAHLSIARDITESKRLERQLLHSQKMEAVGTLAGGIAHDVNNLLQVMLGQADMLLRRGSLDEKSTESVGAIRRSALNGADLVKRILAFSREYEAEMRPVNLSHEVLRIQGLLRRTIPRMIRIEMNLAEDLWMISADASQLEQVILNLAVNAKHAMSDGGRLIFETKNETFREDYCRVHPEVNPGKYVLMSVSDSGEGIEKGTLDRIFEPFFTTKQPGEGTGLGLSMVFGMVKSHGGHISCYSEVGVGTTFRVYFPVGASDLPTAVADTIEMPAGGTESLLLVDDEEPVRTLGAEMLELAGYTVLTAANGREAVEIYSQNVDVISLVILDLVMPEMSGKKCLEELLKIDPNARILIASGYSANGPTKDALDRGATGFISKPFDLKQILLAVRNALDASTEKS